MKASRDVCMEKLLVILLSIYGPLPSMTGSCIGEASRPFERIGNFRDVGRAINSRLVSKRLQTGRLFRSARPDDATDGDVEKLLHKYSIKTIVDLRTLSERLKHGSSTTREAWRRVPEVNYQSIDMNGGTYAWRMFFQLSLLNRAKVAALMLLGNRMEAIRILGQEVLQPQGLMGLGRDTLDFCGHEIRKVFALLADPAAYPVMIHCTEGKDRTGLIIALVLFMLHVPAPAVSWEYMLSQTQGGAERERRVAEIRDLGLTEEFADAPASWAGKMHGHLSSAHGGVIAYLDRIGVDSTMREQIRHNLLRSDMALTEEDKEPK